MMSYKIYGILIIEFLLAVFCSHPACSTFCGELESQVPFFTFFFIDFQSD